MNEREIVRVLIAEDNLEVRKVIGKLLGTRGHTIAGEAADGLEAVQMAQSLQPDVILMDIRMPNLDGIEAARRIYECCPAPVVVLSAHDKPELVERASKAGAGAYLVKPATASEIERAISIAMARFDDMMTLRRLNDTLQAEIVARTRMKEEIEQYAVRLALLNDIGAKIAAVLNLDELLDRAVHRVQESFGYHHVALFTLDRERGELALQAKAGAFTDLFPPDHRLTLSQGMVGWVGRRGETLLANDVDTEPNYVNFFPDAIPSRSALCVPIQVGGKVVGVLDVQSPQRNAFDDHDVMVLETLANQIAVAIENARLHGAVQQELAERKRAEAQRDATLQALQESAR